MWLSLILFDGFGADYLLVKYINKHKDRQIIISILDTTSATSFAVYYCHRRQSR